MTKLTALRQRTQPIRCRQTASHIMAYLDKTNQKHANKQKYWSRLSDPKISWNKKEK